MISRIAPLCKFIVLLLLLLLPITNTATAETDFTPQSPKKSAAENPTLPTVMVVATRLDPLTGGTVLDQQQLNKIPSRNNNTSDLLKLLPGVQMPEEADSSSTAGEIAPAAVSISGGRPYDNNFRIDGIGNNSLLDPQFKIPSNINDVPGHPQEIFLLNNLVQEISVLRSNIPSRYGGFTGGVIDIITIDPADTFGGNISYRASHSDWTKFHIDPDKQTDFDNSVSEKLQPCFFKQNISATIHTPINDHSGMVFDYSILDSDIPLDNLGVRESQSRRSENFFAKYKNVLSDETTLTLSALYAPYEGDYFLKNTKASNYTIKGGGYSLSGKLSNNGTLGESEFMLGIKTSQNSRRGPANRFNWRNTGIKDWGPKNFSAEGGHGDLDKTQQSLASGLQHQFNGFRIGSSSTHRISSGLEAVYTKANYDRLSENSNHSIASANTNVDCNGDNSDCIDGEQFLWHKRVYPKDTADAHMTQLALYTEDSISIKRVTLRPGLRADWDDYLENLNLAPRLASAYDLFGNGATTLIAGVNRYYGRNLLTIRLAEQKASISTWKRSTTLDLNNQPEPWAEVPPSSILTSRVADLNTPYSDELTAGLRQEFFSGVLELDYIDRQGHDLIVTRSYETDPLTKIKYSEWSNAGRSHHQQANLSWSRDWEKSAFSLTATWQKTTGNSDTYTDSETELDELIWYKGKVGTRDELRLDDYNRPFRAAAILTTEIIPRLTFSNTTIYRSAYKSTEKIDDHHLLPDGNTIDAYEEVSNDQALIFDWKFTLEVLQKKNLGLALTLDIYNVFDKQTHLGSSDTDSELGRQFWLGASCDF